MSKLFSLLSPNAPLTQLADSPTRFKKQLIRFGDWVDPIFPEEVMTIDRAKLESFVRNFKNGIPGRIPVPVTHTDNPEFNRGELVDLMIEGDGTRLEDGLYGILEIRVAETAEAIRGGTIWDVSISFTDNYSDTETGELYGPTLLHVALVNNPYIKKMGGFAELAEDFKKLFGSKMEYRMLSENANVKESKMTKVKNDRDFPVTVTFSEGDEEVTHTIEAGAELEVPEDAVEGVQTAIAEAEAPTTDEDTPDDTEGENGEQEHSEQGEDDTEGGEEETAQETTELSETERLKRELAEKEAKLRQAEVDRLYEQNLRAGKIVPAQESAFRALAEAVHGQTRNLSDGKTVSLSDLLANFLAKAPKIVSLDDERGTNQEDSKDDPVKNLPEESKRGLAAGGVTVDEYLKYGAKESVSINELKKED